jgi:hypothetical protein
MEEKPASGPLQERRLWWSDSGGHSRTPHPVFVISPPPTTPPAPGASPSWPPQPSSTRLAAAFTISPVPTSS